MKVNKKLLIQSIALPLAVGALSAFFTSNAMKSFSDLIQPPLSPPGWVFPVVWTILYILMGISSYLIQTSGADPELISDAMLLYNYQLIVNFLWPVFFFSFEWYLIAFLWLILLWILVVFMIVRFSKISKTDAYLNIPYILWITFAGYLNFAIWWLTW